MGSFALLAINRDWTRNGFWVKSRHEMSSSGSFGVRMEGLNRLLGRVVNLK